MSNNLSKILWSAHSKTTRAVSAALAVAFSASFIVGSKVDVSNNSFTSFSLLDPVAFCLLSGICYFVLIGLYRLMLYIEPLMCDNQARITHRKISYIVFIFIFLCWLPYFLIYYPGSMTYDSYYVAAQAVMGAAPSDWHPFTYTLIVRVIMRFGMLFGDITAGVAAYSLAQMTFMAGAIAYGICWLYRRQLHIYVITLTILYFAFVPIFPMLAITMWKDVPFSACILLYTLCLYDVIESKGKNLCRVSGTLQLILLASFVALLRHNGYYIILLTAASLAIYLRKLWRKILPALLLPLLIVPVLQNAYYANGVSQGKFYESLSIPAQQLARTVISGGTITQDQWEQLSNFFDIEQLNQYDPFLADPVKTSFHSEYLETHKLQFFKLWAKLLPSNFKQYCKAYIMETLGYWMPGIHYWIVLPLAKDAEQIGVRQTNLLQASGGNLWTEMANLYQFISIGTMVWITAFFAGLNLIKRRAIGLVPLVPLFLLWLTIMTATPVYCEFRYILALPLTLPFIICISLMKWESGSSGCG